MIKVLLLLIVLLCLVAFINTKPILQTNGYDVKKKIINTPVNRFYPIEKDIFSYPFFSFQDAPKPVAPFNQAIQINYMLYLTGQIGIDPKTGQMVSDDVREQTIQVLRNLEAVLNAAGSSTEQLAHCLIMLTNIDRDYEIVNQIYSQWLKSPEFYPARSSMGVAKLPFNATVAIECQAYTTKEI